MLGSFCDVVFSALSSFTVFLNYSYLELLKLYYWCHTAVFAMFIY